MITGLYAGVLGIIYLYLCARVIKMRFKHKANIGDNGVEEMHRAIRVQANFIEYVPMTLIMMVIAEIMLPYTFTPYYLHALGVVLVCARLGHAYGLSKSAGTSRGRFMGTVATYLVLLTLSLTLIIQFVIA